MDFVTVRNPRIPFIFDMHLHTHTHIYLHVYVDKFFIGLFTANKAIETISTNIRIPDKLAIHKHREPRFSWQSAQNSKRVTLNFELCS